MHPDCQLDFDDGTVAFIHADHHINFDIGAIRVIHNGRTYHLAADDRIPYDLGDDSAAILDDAPAAPVDDNHAASRNAAIDAWLHYLGSDDNDMDLDGPPDLDAAIIAARRYVAALRAATDEVSE